MKIIFMGTPDFAVPSLCTLLESQYQLLAVVTTPDLPRGRGQKITPTPVKAEALKYNVPVLQPQSLKDQNFVEELKSFGADVFVVVAFRILPKEIFTIPKYGTFNLHASLLPKYRGAAPINWALINGETESGVTTFFIQEKVDTGNIILQNKISISPDETAGELHDRLSAMGAETVLQTVDLIEKGNIVPLKQDNNLATPAPKIFHESCRIDWKKSAQEIHNFVRGLCPYPAAWTIHDKTQLKIYRTRITDLQSSQTGRIICAEQKLIVATGDRTIEILELKAENRKQMSADAFLRGYHLQTGEIFL